MIRASVTITEIGPRDGFQNIKTFIPTVTKFAIIDAIAAAGVKRIQCTSFVSSKAIPQMEDAKEVATYALERYPQKQLFALVPNYRGAQAAAEIGLKEVAVVVSCSESHNKANVNKTHTQSITEIESIMKDFPALSLELDVATAFGCPFEGEMQVGKLLDFIGMAYSIGIRKYNICDTIGVAYPKQVNNVFTCLKSRFMDCRFSAHIHDTRNMGILCTLEAIRCGVLNVQTTLGGLGGCPFAPGASGNTSTEDLNYLLLQEGYETGISQKNILEAAKTLFGAVKGNYSGHHIHIERSHTDFIL